MHKIDTQCFFSEALNAYSAGPLSPSNKKENENKKHGNAAIPAKFLYLSVPSCMCVYSQMIDASFQNSLDLFKFSY